MKIIRELDDYIAVAGKGFTIFAGSYVSVMNSVAPDVPTIKRDIIITLCRRFIDQSVRTPESYIASIISASISGTLRLHAPRQLRLKSSLDELKFEEFIRLVAGLHPEGSFVFKLINRVFYCEPSYYNLNHQAIAYLLAKGFCRSVLTTNFDTGIENACRARGFHATVETGVSRLSDGDISGRIIKLHGCAKLDDIIATSTSLYNLSDHQQLSFVPDIIGQGPCLSFGYSGIGDIDIAPHLRSLPARKFIWGNIKEERSPFDGPIAVMDLTCDDPDKNLLLGLATRLGWKRSECQQTPSYQPQLDSLIRSCTREYAIDALLEVAGHGNPDLHALYWSLRRRSNFITYDHLWLKAPRMLAIPLNFEASRELNQYSQAPIFQAVWRAFIRWRLGSSGVAIKSLKRLVLKLDHTVTENHFPIVRASEMLLGVLAESTWKRRAGVRGQFIGQHADVLQKMDNLCKEDWWRSVETVDQAFDRRKRKIELEYNAGAELATVVSDLRRLFEQSRDLALHGVAMGIVLSSWLVDRGFGDQLYAQLEAMRPAPFITRGFRKKRRSHRSYDGSLSSRLRFRFWERLLPVLAELGYHISYRIWGRIALWQFEHQRSLAQPDRMRGNKMG